MPIVYRSLTMPWMLLLILFQRLHKLEAAAKKAQRQYYFIHFIYFYHIACLDSRRSLELTATYNVLVYTQVVVVNI